MCGEKYYGAKEHSFRFLILFVLTFLGSHILFRLYVCSFLCDINGLIHVLGENHYWDHAPTVHCVNLRWVQHWLGGALIVSFAQRGGRNELWGLQAPLKVVWRYDSRHLHRSLRSQPWT